MPGIVLIAGNAETKKKERERETSSLLPRFSDCAGDDHYKAI